MRSVEFARMDIYVKVRFFSNIRCLSIIDPAMTDHDLYANPCTTSGKYCQEGIEYEVIIFPFLTDLE